MIRTLLLASVAIGLSGCATTLPAGPMGLTVTGNDYCKIFKKQTWVPADTRPTIDEINRENAKHDKLCKNKIAGM